MAEQLRTSIEVYEAKDGWRWRSCTIEGCERKHQGRGFCNVHYQRWLKYGDPLHSGVRDRRPWLERFMSRIVKHGDGECWEWLGSTRGRYGMFTDPDDQHLSVGAHILSYQLHYGPIDDGQWVLHRCDNPPCTNPAHLFLGSNLDNIHDMVSKKRNTHHADHPKAKLTAEQVRDIRSRYSYRGVDNIVTLAAEYKLSTATVGQIVRHETWRDLV